MSAMTDEQVKAVLERIAEGFAWDWDNRANLDESQVYALRLLAESQQALGEIHGLLQHQLDNEEPDDLVTILQLLDALMIIASKHWKGRK